MKKSIFLVIVLFSLKSFAQSQPPRAADTAWKKKMDTSSIIVQKDPRIDLLVKKQIQINEVTSRDARKIGKGYRLLIISTSKLDEATAAKTKVYTYFPELKAYLWHQAPYFKVKAGNFKKEKMRKIISEN